MANVVEKAVEALTDLKDPKGKMDADTAALTIINNLQLGESDLSALDISAKKTGATMTHEVLNALAHRYKRQEDEVLTDLRNPNGKINPKAAESMIINEITRKEYFATQGIINKNQDILQEVGELKSLLSKRHVREGLVVWDDLKNPQGELDANVARFLIQNSFKEAGITLAALDTSGKRSEKEMTAEFDDALSKRYVRQGLEAWDDLKNPEGKFTAKEAESIIKDNFRDGRVTLAALDTSGKKSEKEMADEFNKAFSNRADRADKQWDFNPDAIIKFVEDLGKKTAPGSGNSLETPRQFTPTVQGEVAPGAKR